MSFKNEHNWYSFFSAGFIQKSLYTSSAPQVSFRNFNLNGFLKIQILLAHGWRLQQPIQIQNPTHQFQNIGFTIPNALDPIEVNVTI